MNAANFTDWLDWGAVGVEAARVADTMRLSTLKLYSKVIHPAAKMSRRNLLRICGTILIAEIVLAVYAEEFAFPTPDMVYDFHMKFSREFADFATGSRGSAEVFRHIGDSQKRKVN
ncbi:unnamed protein product [Litomosoides sigmodontis]|uniref:Uncharacterized protein n=1 Tax=Litomosoides sigmodontis TaxID=42156 RepID=A0A3P6S9V4_LITSI|nr:unnamed protein product [Litomosoides sigmodontis]